MKRHWKLWVRGKVQGVYYRKSAKEKAEELALNGWVKNELDGSVFIEAEGDEETLRQFADWCKLGPPNALVSEVKIEVGDIQRYSAFEIRR